MPGCKSSPLHAGAWEFAIAPRKIPRPHPIPAKTSGKNPKTRGRVESFFEQSRLPDLEERGE
jgi:hypothetical protein